MKYSHFRFVCALLALVHISFSPLSGQTWKKINKPANSLFNFDVAVLSNGVVAVDDIQGVWVSTNSGTTWTLTLNTHSVLRMQATDILYALGGLSGAFIYASNGVGSSWSNLASTSITSPYVICIGVRSQDELYALGTLFGGSGPILYKTTDRGATWTSISDSLAPYLQEIIPGSGNMLYGVQVYGSQGSRGFYRSTDGGASWSMSNTGITDPSYSSLATTTSLSPLVMKGQDTLFLGTSGGKLYRSVDKGLSWQAMSVPFSDTSTLAVLIVTSTNEIYAAAKTDTQSAIYRSPDNGETWSAVGDPLSGVSFSSMAITPRNTVVVMGDHDLYTNDSTFKVTGVAEKGAPAPAGFRLEPNYPNPFNPSTDIGFTITARCHVTLSIFNLLGQQVARLVDEEKMAGNYTVSWNAANVSSGIYYYRMTAGTFSEMRKMVVVK